MISVDDHLARILATVRRLRPFPQDLIEAHGCTLCEDIAAPHDLPGFDNSAMDGYAVRAGDLAGASAEHPVLLPVVGDLPAGPAQPIAVGPGMAVRIMTGAAMPHGADAVVPVEWTDGGVAKVAVDRAPEPGAYVRRRGDDVTAGDALLPAGTVLGAREIALLAAAGQGSVLVRPRPRVVVLSTGSELREPGEPLADGLVADANGYALAAAAREAGAVAYRVGIVPDDPRQLRTTLEDQLVRADLVVTSGGVSAGAYDIVKQVLAHVGTVEFTGVAMQPGKPQGFGVIGEDDTPIFTLPGNPVSAYVAFQVFVVPALRAMVGTDPVTPPTVPAIAAEGWRASPGKRQYARVRFTPSGVGGGAGGGVGGQLGEVRPCGGSGSHLVGGLARANALAIVPEDVSEVRPGDRLDVLPLP